jgi:hypothetical protein
MRIGHDFVTLVRPTRTLGNRSRTDLGCGIDICTPTGFGFGFEFGDRGSRS